MAVGWSPGGTVGISVAHDKVRREVGAVAVLALLVASVSLLFWLLSERTAQLALGVALVVGVVADGVFAHRAVRGGAVELTSPAVALADQPSPWLAVVRGCPRPVSLRLLLLGPVEDIVAVDGRPGTLLFPPLPRGLVPYVVVDLVARGPLGLIGAGRRFRVAFREPVPITPVPVRGDDRWPEPRARSFGAHEGAPVGDDLFRTVRPYQFGDERRRVHWKATAHHGELMVRESDGLGIVRVRIVVDLGPPGPDAEWAAGLAVWTVRTALARGWHVDLVTLDGGADVAALVDLGRTFRTPPLLAPPVPRPLPTVSQPVRSVAEGRRRLASAAHGRPEVADAAGWSGLTCHVTQAGLAWT